MSALLWRRFWWGGRGFINPVRRLYSMHHVSKLYECQGAWIDTTKDYTSMWHHEAYTWCIIIAFGNFYLILYRNTYRSSIITILRYLHRFSICVFMFIPPSLRNPKFTVSFQRNFEDEERADRVCELHFLTGFWSHVGVSESWLHEQTSQTSVVLVPRGFFLGLRWFQGTWHVMWQWYTRNYSRPKFSVEFKFSGDTVHLSSHSTQYI